VKKNTTKIRTCKERQPGVSGTVLVKVQIGKNGAVSSARVTGKYKGTAVGDCVSSKVRAFRFPQFSGDAMRINLPFSL